jgi:hypothetical protein
LKGLLSKLTIAIKWGKYRGFSAFLKFGSLLCWWQKRNTFHVLGRPQNFNPGKFEEHFGQSSGFGELAT